MSNCPRLTGVFFACAVWLLLPLRDASFSPSSLLGNVYRMHFWDLQAASRLLQVQALCIAGKLAGMVRDEAWQPAVVG